MLGGTDAGGPPFVIPGFDLHNELAALVDAGFTPLEALQSVTLDAAQFLGRADDFGTVANGKAADFVLLDANPLDDIHNTQKKFALWSFRENIWIVPRWTRCWRTRKTLRATNAHGLE